MMNSPELLKGGWIVGNEGRKEGTAEKPPETQGVKLNWKR